MSYYSLIQAVEPTSSRRLGPWCWGERGLADFTCHASVRRCRGLLGHSDEGAGSVLPVVHESPLLENPERDLCRLRGFELAPRLQKCLCEPASGLCNTLGCSCLASIVIFFTALGLTSCGRLFACTVVEHREILHGCALPKTSKHLFRLRWVNLVQATLLNAPSVPVARQVPLAIAVAVIFTLAPRYNERAHTSGSIWYAVSPLWWVGFLMCAHYFCHCCGRVLLSLHSYHTIFVNGPRSIHQRASKNNEHLRELLSTRAT